VEASPPAARGHERVLLVEDSHLVRQAQERILVDAGYDVYTAPNGVAALCLVAALSEAPAVLITDLMMPEMGGRAILARLRDDNPGLKALLVSGFEPGTEADAVMLPEGTHYLQKPFTGDALLRAVRELLDSDRPISE
jgi:CheY-like chemotaxis protein